MSSGNIYDSMMQKLITLNVNTLSYNRLITINKFKETVNIYFMGRRSIDKGDDL